MNHHQRKVLHAIFAHPVNANLEMKDIETVLNGLGAEFAPKTKSRIGVRLNGKETVLHLANHTLMRGGGDRGAQVSGGLRRVRWDFSSLKLDGLTGRCRWAIQRS